MDEPAYGKTIGLAANLDREQKFVDSIAEFKKFEAPVVLTGDDAATYENVMEWTTTDGQDVHVEQVYGEQRIATEADLKAFVILNKDHDASDELAADLIAYSREKLAGYKRPRWVVFVDELPKTATGKIQRFRLREM